MDLRPVCIRSPEGLLKILPGTLLRAAVIEEQIAAWPVNDVCPTHVITWRPPKELRQGKAGSATTRVAVRRHHVPISAPNRARAIEKGVQAHEIARRVVPVGGVHKTTRPFRREIRGHADTSCVAWIDQHGG